MELLTRGEIRELEVALNHDDDGEMCHLDPVLSSSFGHLERVAFQEGDQRSHLSFIFNEDLELVYVSDVSHLLPNFLVPDVVEIELMDV